MTTSEEILRGIKKRSTLDGLAKELGLRKPVLMSRIEFMVREGYLREIGSRDRCEGCLMKCNAPEGIKIKMYALTKKGVEHIKHGKK